MKKMNYSGTAGYMLIAQLESCSIPAGILSFSSKVFIQVKATQIECAFINARNCLRLSALIWKRIAFQNLLGPRKYSRLTREIQAESRNSLYQFLFTSWYKFYIQTYAWMIIILLVTTYSRLLWFVFRPILIAFRNRRSRPKISVRATACMSSCSPCLHILPPAYLPSTVSSLSPPFPSLPLSFLAVTSLFSGSIKKSGEGEDRGGWKRGEKQTGDRRRGEESRGRQPSVCLARSWFFLMRTARIPANWTWLLAFGEPVFYMDIFAYSE